MRSSTFNSSPSKIRFSRILRQRLSFSCNFELRNAVSLAISGLVSFSPNICLHTLDGRRLCVTVSHIHSDFEPFHLFILYAPASTSPRFTFFNHLLQSPFSESLSPWLPRCIFLGDFNYSYSRSDSSYLQAPTAWRDFMDSTFVNLLYPPHSTIPPLPTFQSSPTRSSIGQFFVSPSLYPLCSPPDIIFLNPQWTDHALISCSLRLTTSTRGKGLWRVNPRLVRSPKFCSTLTQTLDELLPSLATLPSPQLRRDTVKDAV